MKWLALGFASYSLLTVLTTATSTSSLSEHLLHFFVLGLLNVFLLFFSFNNNPTLKSITLRTPVFVVSLLLLFTVSHVLPCHMLIQPADNLQSHSQIQYPCCVTLTPALVAVSVVPQTVVSKPMSSMHDNAVVSTFDTHQDNKSPPFFS